MDFDAPCRTSWGPRLLGLGVLLGVVGASAFLALGDGAPAWTWVVLAFFGVVAAIASVSNFGDRFEFDESGIRFRNVVTERLGWARGRAVPWSRVLRASEYEGRTWFVHVADERRWVLDQLDGHERLRHVFQQHGIPISEVQKPKLWHRDHGGTR